MPKPEMEWPVWSQKYALSNQGWKHKYFNPGSRISSDQHHDIATGSNTQDVWMKELTSRDENVLMITQILPTNNKRMYGEQWDYISPLILWL